LVGLTRLWSGSRVVAVVLRCSNRACRPGLGAVLGQELRRVRQVTRLGMRVWKAQVGFLPIRSHHQSTEIHTCEAGTINWAVRFSLNRISCDALLQKVRMYLPNQAGWRPPANQTPTPPDCRHAWLRPIVFPLQCLPPNVICLVTSHSSQHCIMAFSCIYIIMHAQYSGRPCSTPDFSLASTCCPRSSLHPVENDRCDAKSSSTLHRLTTSAMQARFCINKFQSSSFR